MSKRILSWWSAAAIVVAAVTAMALGAVPRPGEEAGTADSGQIPSGWQDWVSYNKVSLG